MIQCLSCGIWYPSGAFLPGYCPSCGAEIKLRAERRAGELLKEREMNQGGRPIEKETSNIMLPVIHPPKLEELGISKVQSSRWQLEAQIPEEVRA